MSSRDIPEGWHHFIEKKKIYPYFDAVLLLLSHFSRVRLRATP